MTPMSSNAGTQHVGVGRDAHEKGLPSRVSNILLGKAGAAFQVEGRCPPAQMAFPQLLLTRS